MNKLERNLLAEFYSRLATMAFERHQWELAAEYASMANAVYR
jgi:hypothetical protein